MRNKTLKEMAINWRISSIAPLNGLVPINGHRGVLLALLSESLRLLKNKTLIIFIRVFRNCR